MADERRSGKNSILKLYKCGGHPKKKREQLEKQSHLKNAEQNLNLLSFFIKHTLKDKLQNLGQELSVKIKDSLYQNDTFYQLPPNQRDEHHAVTAVRLDRIHAQQQEVTLACDSKILDKQKPLDVTNQQVKKYTPEIERQERLVREQRESALKELGQQKQFDSKEKSL